MSASDSLDDHKAPTFTHSASRDRHEPNINPPRHSCDYLFHANTNTNTSRTGSRRNSPYPADSYFQEAFRSTPSPPPHTSFLDNILNPAEPTSYSFSAPSRNTSPSRGSAQAPIVSTSPVLSPSLMPHRRLPRLPNGYVDLTSEPDQPAEQTKRESPTPSPSTKRLKRTDGTAAKRSPKPPANIEEIDLSEDTPIQDVLQKQRVEAVKSQQKPEEKATTFNNFNCVICMDTPTNITATSCGHLFCHTCLMEALIAGENRTGPNEPKRSQCPVCRKFINRTKQSDIIPLMLRKGLATQPRKSSKVTS